MYRIAIALFFFLVGFLEAKMLFAGEKISHTQESNKEETESYPPYLYKILSSEGWEKSQKKSLIVVPKEDEPFIHFATQDQLERILGKYWKDASSYVLLKVDVAQLHGKLVYETNPGGSAKYFHLYEGAIPLSAVVEVNIVKIDPDQG